MDSHGWVRKRLIAVVTITGEPSQLAAGVINTSGGDQLVVQIDGADEVILPGLQSAAEHITHVNRAKDELERRRHERHATRAEPPHTTLTRTKAGAPVGLVVGVAEAHMYFQVGDDDTTRVYVPGPESADEHVKNVRDAMAFKYERDREAGR